jgi:hypothetical protein
MVFRTRTNPGDEVLVHCVQTKSEGGTQMLSVRKICTRSIDKVTPCFDVFHF